ncbi:PREDICTED: ras and EF-hand domain-containing protein homolog isoform X1 [Wasmannia auropunctata]|uniref:ras and EF-hand domain-containing protein homolog isoform X1 n=1 Tax=Wasmannia auropunctata TaxID=64793 RepID=UPI0005EFD75C|nr:PREDICTED: ras and EF-hand domain-containing protein homolog isoform X1 [Wasmannia auropunctata]XP_011699022.1 PREDICTED: ras and EF-hand domain-containing protein homolog isoform X1 [Wasmannia auropunctata]XP_011699023.1 PREDICTED: ras and EF-hand domain-containing protein homolog isoform X1 [Wasmannia auropunctata]
MDRNESGTNEGGSSPDTVIACSSSEEEKQKSIVASTSGEYITVGDSSSSLDTLTSGSVAILSSSGNADDRKRSKFGALKSSFREGSLFKIKKKNRGTDVSSSLEAEQHDKEVSQQQSQQLEGEKESKLMTDAPSSATLKKKKKKSHSLVRKLSWNKFRMSSEQQEPRHTPEGGNSSRSQSQSSQESPIHTYATRKENDTLERVKEELKKPEKIHEKPTKTVSVVLRKSPSLTIKSFAETGQQDTERYSQQETRDNTSRSDEQCISTLPYALSRWPERSETKLAEDLVTRRGKVKKYDSDSSECMPSTSSPVEVRRKLSLLEEKRAIFQRRFFDSTSKDATRSDETVIDVNARDDRDDLSGTNSNEFLQQREEERKKKVRHISVKTFDTFSDTFGNTLDEEDFSEDYNDTSSNYRRLYAAMAPMLGAVDPLESSSNNAPNLGVSEKREHLYKILVIGELGAGKTSIIKRYVHQFFSQHYRATIGVDFALKVLNWDPHTIIRLQLWDIAGQERFGNMTRVYYKEAVGAFIVFDVTRSATLDAVVKWKQDLDSKVQLPDGSPIPCVLLANKCDQQKEGLVNSPAKMDEYCKEKNFSGWFETSAKENINIEEAAKFLVNKILQNDQVIRDNGVQEQADGERFTLNQSPTSSKKSCSC